LIVGVVGAGRIGRVHSSLLSDIEDVDELLLNDADHARAEQLAADLPRASTSSLDETFERSDAVLIASSTDTHAPLLHRAADAGLPAFCQKPISLDLESTRSAIEAVERAGIIVQMGFQRRYDPEFSAIRERVDSGDVGTVYLIRSQTHDPEPPPLDYIPVSGGIFKDCLVHDIDAVRFVTGQDIVSVSANGAVLGFPEIGRLGDVDSATVIAEMSGGTLAQLSCLRHDPIGYDVRLEVFGSNESVAAGLGPRTPIKSQDAGWIAAEKPVHDLWDRFADAYRLEMEAFVRVAQGLERPASTPRDAEAALKVATACGVSMREARPVSLEEFE